MAEADRLEQARTVRQLVAEHEPAGLHPAAFATCRKLVKAGPAEARTYYAALGRYLEMAGMLK